MQPDQMDRIKQMLLQMMMSGGGFGNLGAIGRGGISLGSRFRGIGPDARAAGLGQLSVPMGMAAANQAQLPPQVMAALNHANPGAGGVGGGMGGGQAPFNPAPGGGLSSGLSSAPSGAPASAGPSSAGGSDPTGYIINTLFRRMFDNGTGYLQPYQGGQNIGNGQLGVF